MKSETWNLVDLAEDVLGSAENGSVKVLIVAPPPTLPLGDT